MPFPWTRKRSRDGDAAACRRQTAPTSPPVTRSASRRASAQAGAQQAGPHVHSNTIPAAAPPVETAIQGQVRRQQEWLTENLPSSEELRIDVLRALNSLRVGAIPRKSEFKNELFGRLRFARPPPEPAGYEGPTVYVEFQNAVLLKSIALESGGTSLGDTAFYGTWSSARDSAKAAIAAKSSSSAQSISETEEKQQRFGKSTAADSVNSRSFHTVVSTRTETNSVLKYGPIPDGGYAIEIQPDCRHDQPWRYALVNIFALRIFPLRTGSVGDARLDGELGWAERYDRNLQQRQAMIECMAYCLTHRQMGGSGLGIAIAGESFSRMRAISPTRLIVEVSAEVWEAVHATGTTVTDLFPVDQLRPVLAHSFLNGVSWNAGERIKDVDMKAVNLFRDFCLTSVSLVSKINGPKGPIALPAEPDSPPFGSDSDQVAAATQTLRMYQILRGEAVGNPPEPLKPFDDVDELAPEDSISNDGFDEDGGISEAFLSDMAAGVYTIHTVQRL